MTFFEMETAELIKLINTLTKLTQETEWVEFKHNFHSPEEIGERLSDFPIQPACGTNHMVI